METQTLTPVPVWRLRDQASSCILELFFFAAATTNKPSQEKCELKRKPSATKLVWWQHGTKEERKRGKSKMKQSRPISPNIFLGIFFDTSIIDSVLLTMQRRRRLRRLPTSRATSQRAFTEMTSFAVWPAAIMWCHNPAKFQCFFDWRIFAKFRPEKYDFDLHKGFFHEKTDPNSPDFEEFFFQIARFLW